jgi:hypothetical protein
LFCSVDHVIGSSSGRKVVGPAGSIFHVCTLTPAVACCPTPPPSTWCICGFARRPSRSSTAWHSTPQHARSSFTRVCVLATHTHTHTRTHTCTARHTRHSLTHALFSRLCAWLLLPYRVGLDAHELGGKAAMSSTGECAQCGPGAGSAHQHSMAWGVMPTRACTVN